MNTVAERPITEPSVHETQVAEYSKTASALAGLSQRYAGVVFNVGTPQGMREAKAGRQELRGLRIDLEKKRVEIKAPALERCRIIDSEAKRITTELLKLEEPIDNVIKVEDARVEAVKAEYERAEQVRIMAIQTKIADIRALPLSAVGKTAAEILQMAEEADVIVIDPSVFGGYANEASIARNAVAAKLRQAHAAQVVVENERAELDRLRAEQLVRDEQLRIEREAQELAARQAREQQDAADKLERERQDAVIRAQREEIDRMAAEQKAHEEQQRLEREKHDAELAAQREELARQEAQLAQERAALSEQSAQSVPQPVAAPKPASPVQSVAASPKPNPMLDDARGELVQFSAKYHGIAELAGVMAAIDAFVAS